MERFLIAAHEKGASIERSPNNEKTKLVDGTELHIDTLKYFTENKDSFRDEFAKELEGKISQEEFKIFCEVVALEWYDGKRMREEGRCHQLKRSIYDYLCTVANNTLIQSQLIQTTVLPTDVEPLISSDAIAKILTVNDQMIYRHIEEWKMSHPSSDTISTDDIFLRRGLALESELDTSKPYQEWDFINSYSIAFSVPEKFSQMMHGRKPAIVNGELSLFENRVLFFSPFIPGMDVGQLEFGIIPCERLPLIHAQGTHGGILEYIIDPAPFQI
ncbi:hypothetical protein [Pseudomonas protegens]|nr:hypothetical protein [Pseudomonas protegens]